MSLQNEFFSKTTKLTNDQYDLCFQYFDSLDKTEHGLRDLKIGEKWRRTSQFALEEFNIEITVQSLRKNYPIK
jgi:hypothetical protein